MTRILLVEDNEMNRDMLSRRLERRGFEIGIAVDGRQGVEMATAGGFDLVLMDMSLPEVDGWEATRQLRGESTSQVAGAKLAVAHGNGGMLGSRHSGGTIILGSD